jgi:CubicO group peptidase (beta-lactamase class C family)
VNLAQDVLERVVAAAEEDGFTARGAHVLIGEESAAHHWIPDARRDVQSVAKGVCVLAAGIASDAGLFDLDAPVADHFPEWELGDGVDSVTTRHLLSMRSGIDLPWSETLMTDWPDLAREFLARPSSGRVFQYSTASTYTAMRALATKVGDVHDWLAPRLFAPLGIEHTYWEHCPRGSIVAAGGLHLTNAELARLGQLIRDDGLWGGRHIVSSRWPAAMRSEWSWHEADPNYERYSLAGWGGPGAAWRLHGAYGQMLIFLGPAVVTITADDHFGADRMAVRVVEILTGGDD